MVNTADGGKYELNMYNEIGTARGLFNNADQQKTALAFLKHT